MPQRKRIFVKALLPLGLLAMAAASLRRSPDAWEYERIEEEVTGPELLEAPVQAAPTRRPARRIAMAATFSTLFFAGAAFTAGAGDQFVRLADDDAATLEEAANLTGAPPVEAQPEAVTPEAAAPEAAPAEPTPTEAPVAEAPAEVAPASAAETASPEAVETAAPSTAAAQAAEPAAEPAPAAATAPSNVVAKASAASSSGASPQAAAPKPAPAATKPTKQWVVKRAAAPPAPAPEIEHEHGGEATIWLNRALPDPTPASARLTRSFAKHLVAASTRNHADWASVLGVLRAQGERGSVPASKAELDTLARRLSGTTAWKGALALSGRTGFADRAAAFADLYRFVGIESLVTGYQAAKGRLAHKVLSTPGILIYAGGRTDVMMGRIDVRVLVMIGYLAERHGSVTVSSLFSGHRKFARPGVVSAHIYGHAVDIAAVGGTPIAGHQQPGGLTEAAVRSVLLLPGELQPRQVISLLGLGGPSFPMRDHGDHIHIGF